MRLYSMQQCRMPMPSSEKDRYALYTKWSHIAKFFTVKLYMFPKIPNLSNVRRSLDGDLGVLAEPVNVLEVVVLEHALSHGVIFLPLLLPRGLFLVILHYGANSTYWSRNSCQKT